MTDYDDIFGGAPPNDTTEYCSCNCTSQNGSGWCFPYELSLKPDPVGIEEEVLDLGPSPSDSADVQVVRSSGSEGVCDTFYGQFSIEAYYCISGKQVKAPEAIPKRTADIGIILPQDICVDYPDVAGTTFDGRPYLPISGVPLTYFPDMNRLVCRWSASICGLDISGCCQERTLLPAYAVCYDIFFKINNDGGPVCENELIAGTDGQGTPRMILITDCQRYSFLDCTPREIDPFAEENPTNPNIWVVSKKAVETQELIPEQSGIYRGGSYIGLVGGPVPDEINPQP
jgi:hypothetical protein